MPADYKYLTDQSSDAPGIFRVADAAVIPPNPSLGAWRDYLAWKVSNTPDPATATTLSARRRSAKFEIDRQAEEQYRLRIDAANPNAPSTMSVHFAMIDESRRIATDGSPTGGNYPLLSQLNSSFGADLAARGATIRAGWAAQSTVTGQINSVRLKAFADVDAAGSLAAIDAVVAALSWP